MLVLFCLHILFCHEQFLAPLPETHVTGAFFLHYFILISPPPHPKLSSLLVMEGRWRIWKGCASLRQTQEVLPCDKVIVLQEFHEWFLHSGTSTVELSGSKEVSTDETTLHSIKSSPLLHLYKTWCVGSFFSCQQNNAQNVSAGSQGPVQSMSCIRGELQARGHVSEVQFNTSLNGDMGTERIAVYKPNQGSCFRWVNAFQVTSAWEQNMSVWKGQILVLVACPLECQTV